VTSKESRFPNFPASHEWYTTEHSFCQDAVLTENFYSTKPIFTSHSVMTQPLPLAGSKQTWIQIYQIPLKS